MSSSIKTEAQLRGITRLCHFTPSRNLVHIASSSDGVRSSSALRSDQSACFTATDTKRIDGYTGHISCSIEYPNGWYLSKAEALEPLFKDWVVLFIAPHYIWHPQTRYCPRNAAADSGGQVVKSLSGFQSLFAQSIAGAYGKTNTRISRHLDCSPTDDQAEVLVGTNITLSDILGVAVRDKTQAKNEIVRLRLAGIKGNPFQFVIAPQLFDKYQLSKSIRAGKRPVELLHEGNYDS
jgi:hypothetical protein